MTDDPTFSRAIAYEDDNGAVVYRASALGSCLGALARARLGVTPSGPGQMMEGRFAEGHDWEARVIASGLGEDWMLVESRDHLGLHGRLVEHGDGWQVETEIAWGKRKDGGGGKVVRCHPDGIVLHRTLGTKRVLEAKFLAEGFALEKIKAVDKLGMLGLGDGYAWQASVEMLSTGLPLLYVIGMKQVEGEGDARRVVGIGSTWVGEFDEPCYSLADVKARVLEVESYVAHGELPPCPVPYSWPCDYWQEHLAIDKAEEEDEMLVDLVTDYQRAKTKADLVAKSIEDLRGAIQDRLIELHLDSTRCNGFDLAHVAGSPGTVSWSAWAKEVRKRFPEVDVDEAAFRGKSREAHLRIAEAK